MTKTTKKSSEATQPEVNIGLIGHVDHGKTTLTERLSGLWTDTHSEELKRGITIRLGYANSEFRKIKGKKGAAAYTTEKKVDGKETELVRKVSFVDAPGHESLMATMLAGATIMDGAILLIAANEECPQPQTREHLMALEIIGIKNVVVVQNKIDLVTEDKALKNYKQIKEFLKGTSYEKAPIIPISAQHGINIEELIEAIEKNIPTLKRDENKEPMMFVARSFDVNKPGIKIKDLKGGVLGGALKQGKLKEGDEVEIRPGHVYMENNQQVWKALTTKITGLMTGNNQIKEVGPGGSIAVMTKLDPTIIKSDQLTGSVVGKPGKLPEVYNSLTLETHLLNRVVGTKKETKVENIKMQETIMLNVNSAATIGIVTDIGKNTARCKLKLPICAEKGSRVTISRLVENRFRLIGYGVIQ